ncbi:MAG: 2-hydroxyacyl-CoA dehydratase family protein [Dehalococcoidales bacterium]|nr:2-hydroxyacyl-CoA dehydratase family protein [Dehalococcoidales bacterium]
MEERLQQLIQGNSETNRIRWAKEWKKQGRKVIGVMSSYVPEEIIWAAGMLPWRITGTWKENVDHARIYRIDKSCPYSTHVLESFLSGELDFLDGIVTSNQDSDLLHLWDVLTYLKLKQLCVCLHPPFTDHEIHVRFFETEVKRLTASIEDFAGVKISDDALLSSINLFNQMRDILEKLYNLRKRENPALTGAEILGITTAAQVMPRDQFIQELQVLMPFLEKREATPGQTHPRLLVCSDKLDNPEYIKLVEENCLVAMDDLDTGVRYFVQDVQTDQQDLAYSIAKRYLSRHGAPRMIDWDKQTDQIIKWVKDFNINGVISLPHAHEQAQAYRWPILKERLEEAGIPSITINREYHFANAGQLRTRIGAFLEMISVS